MTQMSLAYRLSPRCRFRVVGGEGVVVRLDAGEVIALNGIGASVLTLMREGTRTLEDIAKELSREFDVDASTAAHDTVAFTEELLSAGIIEEVRS